MSVIRDDWEKTRSTSQKLTFAEISKLRVAFNCGRIPRDIARELKCSSRTAAKYYSQFRGSQQHHERAAMRPVREAPPKRITKESRFYRGSFEL